MTRSALKRGVAAGLLAMAALPSAGQTLATLRLESLEALTQLVEAVGALVGEAPDRDEMLSDLAGVIGTAGLGVDEGRPLALGLPVAGAAIGWKGFVAVLPVIDVDAALEALASRADTHEIDAEGMHALADRYSAIHVRPWDDHLVIGHEKSFVAGFDAGAAVAGLQALPGAVTIDFDVEPLSIMMQAAIVGIRDGLIDGLIAEDPALGRAFWDAYFDGILALLRDSSRFQAGLRIEADHLLATGRIVPRPDTALAELARAQGEVFSSVAGLVAESRSMSVAGHVTVTRGLRGAMNRLFDIYAATLVAPEGGAESVDGETREEVIARHRRAWTRSFACVSGAFAESMVVEDGQAVRTESIYTLETDQTCREYFADPRNAVDSTPGFAESSRVEKGPTIRGVKTYRVTTDADELAEWFAWLGEAVDPVVPYGDDWPVHVAYRDDLVITTQGDGAGRRLREILERGAERADTLTAGIFRPLRGGGSFYARIHLRDLLQLVAEPGEILDARLMGALPDEEGGLLVSFSGGPEGLTLEVGVPLALLDDLARAAEGIAVAMPVGP